MDMMVRMALLVVLLAGLGWAMVRTWRHNALSTLRSPASGTDEPTPNVDTSPDPR